MLKLYPVTSGRLSIKENRDSIIGYDCDTKKWINLNKNLEDLLVLCDGKKSLNDIHSKILRQYRISNKKAREKISSIFHSLEKDKLIKFTNEPCYKPIRFRKYDFKWPLQSVFIEVTNKCNLKCIHCYNDSSQNRTNELNKKDLFSFLEQVDDMGIFNVFFTGGEPFIREDFNEILNYTYDKGMEIGILTNGTILDLERLTLLEKINPKFVAVSLDALEESKYKKVRGIGNKKVISNVLRLKEKGINVRINTVLFNNLNNSYEDIKDLSQFFKNHNFNGKDFAIDEFLEIGRGSKSLKYSILKKEETINNITKAFKDVYGNEYSVRPSYSDENKPIKSSFCGLGESICYLNPKGDITLCTVLNDERFKTGNIFEKSIREIWETAPLFRYFRERKHILSTECETCSSLSECAGGCKAKPMLLEGTFNKPDYWACSSFNKS